MSCEGDGAWSIGGEFFFRFFFCYSYLVWKGVYSLSHWRRELKQRGWWVGFAGGNFFSSPSSVNIPSFSSRYGRRRRRHHTLFYDSVIYTEKCLSVCLYFPFFQQPAYLFCFVFLMFMFILFVGGEGQENRERTYLRGDDK